MPKRQRGGALVIVLILLVGTVMASIMMGQAGLVGERLASNHRAATIAQMRADTAAIAAIAQFHDLTWQHAPLIHSTHNIRWGDHVGHTAAVVMDQHCGNNECLFIPVVYENQNWAMALGVMKGAQGELFAQSPPIFIRVKDADEQEVGSIATVIWQ